MASFKSNGDPLIGTIYPPSNYPDPVPQNVNMHPIEWAYGVGNTLIGSDTHPPTAPSGLARSNVGQTSFDLSWTASADDRAVTGYKVYNGASVLATVTGTTAHITGLTASTAYTVTVKAHDAANNESAASNSVAVTTTS